MDSTLKISSSAFKEKCTMPRKYTGRGENISPQLELENISPLGKSIAVVMDDLDIPFIKEYNHWLIWNIPIQNIIPENIEHGKEVNSLKGAIQGVGYGKNGYKGPKPPFFVRNKHRYVFNVYILDCKLNLDPTTKKKEFMKAISKHIIQHGSITGIFKN